MVDANNNKISFMVQDLPHENNWIYYEYSSPKLYEKVLHPSFRGYHYLVTTPATDTAILVITHLTAVAYGVALTATERENLNKMSPDLVRLPVGDYVISVKDGEVLANLTTRHFEPKHWSYFPKFTTDIRSVLLFDFSTNQLARLYDADNMSSLLFALSWLKDNAIKCPIESSRLVEHGVKMTLTLIYRLFGLPMHTIGIADARAVTDKLETQAPVLKDRHVTAFSKIFYEMIEPNSDAKTAPPPNPQDSIRQGNQEAVTALENYALLGTGVKTGTVTLSELILEVFQSKPGDPSELEIEFDMHIDGISRGYCRNSLIYLEMSGNDLNNEQMESVSVMFPDPDQVVFLSHGTVIAPHDIIDRKESDGPNYIL